MEVTYEALENGGISLESIAGTATSVYTAIFPTDYSNHLYKDTMELPTYYMAGVEPAMFANRLSHVLDLRGPCMTLDTACSGGLVALHQACQSLRDGESDTSLVTASNLILGPDHFIGLSNLHLLSSTGRCYPFDERGKGYGRGEGVVALVLKRLDDAIRDRDPIRAIVRSSALGQDGYTPQNITYPNGQAQADLARMTYVRAGLEPEDTTYIEAHGTGTKAGDKEELEAIADVFGTVKRSVPLYVGSIKGAVGHTEAVAGLAGFLRATLMLEHDSILPVAGFANPKPDLPLKRIQIPTKVIPWPVGITPRISISSFGFGGTNAHAILERGPRPESVSCQVVPRLFIFSANSPASLKALLQAQHDWIEQHTEAPLADLSFTLLHRRSALPYRFSTVAEDRASLLDKLSISTTKPSLTTLDVVMIFTGQGAQWAGMGRELFSSSIFRQSIQASQDVIHKLGSNWKIETELFRDSSSSRLGQAELVQPITTAIQIALIMLLRTQGVRPRAVVGHSSGEIAAAFAAGHLSYSNAMTIAFYRGLTAGTVTSNGAMLSIGLGEEDATKFLTKLTRGKALIACINSPRSVTVSGDAEAVHEVEERIIAANDGTFHRKLPVNTAYHSHHMRAVADDYLARLTKQNVEENTENEEIPFFSSVTGQLKTSGFGAEYWIANFVSPVRFNEAVQALCKTLDQQKCFIEIGAHPALSGPVRQCLQSLDLPYPFFYHATLQRNMNAITSILTLIGKLFELGVLIHWDAVSAFDPGADTAIVLHNLPAYKWDHSTKHWHESRMARDYRLRKEPYHDLLGVPALNTTNLEPRWRHFLSKATIPWLADYVVEGRTIFPGAGYCCMAIEAISQLARKSQQSLEAVALRDVSFKRGLFIPDMQRVELQLSMKPQQGSDLTFYWSITALSNSEEWFEYATGVVEGLLTEDDVTVEKEGTPRLLSGSNTTHKDTFYHHMEATGNRYGPTFAGLPSIAMAADTSQASFKILDIKATMPAKHQGPHIIHPSTLDIIFQTALPLVNRRLGLGAIVPTHVDEMLIAVHPLLEKPGSKLDVSTQLTSSHFPTAFSNISAIANGRRVLTISAMDFRLLEQNDAADTPEICYELDWQPSINHIRDEDLSPKMALADFFSQTALTCRGQSIIGLGASVDLSEELLNAVEIHDKVTSFDFVDSTHGRFDDAVDHLKTFPVQYRTLRPGANPLARGFEAGVYDLVLAESVKWLNEAVVLVKKSGTILLALCEDDFGSNEWRTMLQETQIEEQLIFRDIAQDKMIVIAKPIDRQPANIHILTHSTGETPDWVSAIEDELHARKIDVTLTPLSSSTVKSLLYDRIIVVEDEPKTPILTDATSYQAAVTLLTTPRRLVWLSPDDPHFHQIEGVARTAHAENDELSLTTIHAAADFLTKKRNSKRLTDIVTNAISQIESSEREYCISEKGTAVVPRLQYSDRLNRAIAGDDSRTEELPFSDAQRPLVLSSGSGLFVDHNVYTMPLLDDMIEVEVEGIVISKASPTATVGEYAGVVARAGASVTSLTPGDHVITIAPVVGASRLRIPCANAARFPSHMPITASAFLLNLMAASYALRQLAGLLSSTSTVLVHGARTVAGRAAVAVARSIGVRITATAADTAEVCLLKEQIGIDAADILVIRRSFRRRSGQDIFSEGLDAVIQAEDDIPVEALTFVKPFGSVIVIGHSSLTTVKMPPNVASHFVDIAGLVQARPYLIAGLVAESTSVLGRVPFSGLELFVGDVIEVAEALQQVNTGVHAKAVLQVSPWSSVKVVPSKSDAWADENATYVIAGGLGDVGGRFLVQMARRGAKHLATISRTVDSNIRDAIQSKLGAGVRLYTLHGDVTSMQSMQSAAATLLHYGAPPIRGVIMAAASIHVGHRLLSWDYTNSNQDCPLESTTYDKFTSVTKVKVDGTLNLYRTFSSSNLAFFLCLSSVSDIVGIPAQANYNAGNSLQDSLTYQKQKETRFLTVNLGWIEDALLTANDMTRQNTLRRGGFSLISSTQLTRFIDYILGAANDPNSSLKQAIIGFDADSIAGVTAYNSTIQSSLFNRVRDGRAKTSASEGANADTPTGQSFGEVLASGDAEAIVDFISASITAQLAHLISIDPGSIDARSGSIMVLGLDSLMAIELRNWVGRTFEAPLQTTDILANQTVRGLAEKIRERSKMT